MRQRKIVKHPTPPERQPCWFCANACGGCEWSKDFRPVPGWDAKPTTITLHNGREKYNVQIPSYEIHACPKFVKDRRA